MDPSDILKSAIGPFIGAGLAFLSAMFWRAKQRKIEAVCAGNLALLVLTSQYNDFVGFRFGVWTNFVRRGFLTNPSAPDWFLAYSVVYPFMIDRRVDYRSIAFLFENAKSSLIFQHLAMAEQRYTGLQVATEDLNAAVVEKRQKIAANFPNADKADITQIKELLGLELVSRISSRVEDLIDRLVTDERVYEDAIHEFGGELTRRFGKRIPKYCGIADHLELAALPLLPASLGPALSRAVESDTDWKRSHPR